MEHWIRGFAGINQSHPDIADYEKFFSQAQIFLRTHPSMHEELSAVLVGVLSTFKSKPLLSITYRLLSSIDSPQIPLDVLRKHFRSRLLRKHIFPLIARLGWSMFDAKLRRLLYNPNYECKSFFRLMACRRPWTVEFLNSSDTLLARKQMMTMIHSGIFHNLGYFVRFFGHRNRSTSFLAFEVFTLFTECLRKREGMVHRDSGFSVWHLGGRMCISLDSPLHVECPANFLIHFFSFIPDNDALHASIARNDGKGVLEVLRRHAVVDSLFPLPDIRWFATQAPQPRRIDFSEEDECFEYLFSGCSYKDITDCIEI